jgi:hypothetical protein
MQLPEAGSGDSRPPADHRQVQDDRTTIGDGVPNGGPAVPESVTANTREHPQNAEEGAPGWGPLLVGVVFGSVLLSHTLAGAVPSALWGLASGFGMGPGVSPTLWLP